jgi:hypothetical protein
MGKKIGNRFDDRLPKGLFVAVVSDNGHCAVVDNDPLGVIDHSTAKPLP